MRLAWRWAWLLLVPAATMTLLTVRGRLDLGTVLLLHLLAVIAVAVFSSIAASSIAAVLAVALVNWYFTVPYGTLRIDKPATVIDLTAFIVVALTSSSLVRRSRRSEAHAEQVEEQRAHVEEIDRSRSALLAAIGHDLRTPISTIKATASGVLASDVPWTETDLQEAWGLVDEEADRLADLLTNLLDKARLEAGSQIVKATEIEVADLVRPLRSAGVPVTFAMERDLPLVIADPGLMERVLHNLAANVQRHGGPGADAVLSAHREGDEVVMSFDDNGRGVEPARLDAIFMPFQVAGDRTRGGTGLGLTIVKAFVEAMGGSVTAEPSPRGGLRISLRLRVAR